MRTIENLLRRKEGIDWLITEGKKLNQQQQQQIVDEVRNQREKEGGGTQKHEGLAALLCWSSGVE